MRRMVEKLLRQFGQEVTVDGIPCRGIFQSVTGKREGLAVHSPGPLGGDSRERYVYIGPMEPELREDMVLGTAGREYLIRAVQPVHGSSGPVYQWAVCVEKGREDGWNSSNM